MIMTHLDTALENAFNSPESNQYIQGVYKVLFKATLILPCRNLEDSDSDTPFIPLFMTEDDKTFIPVFDTHPKFETWAGESLSNIQYVSLKGADCIVGISPDVYLCLNIGTSFYKEFSPDEIKLLKKTLSKITPRENLNH